MADGKPGRPSKADELAAIHFEALEEFGRAYDAVWEDRKACREDRLFVDVTGQQWAGTLGEQFENKLKFEVNKVSLGVQRIINEYRNNRVSIFFVPKDGSESRLSDVCSGLMRADEEASQADEAKDNAFEEAVKGGFGAFRLRAQYEDEDDLESEAQTVRLEPIFDADQCVFFDADARRQDKADSKRCWVLTPITLAKYKKDYGKTPTGWPRGLPRSSFQWQVADTIYLAEYYKVEESETKVYDYESLTGDKESLTAEQIEDDSSLQRDLEARGFVLKKVRRVRAREVSKYLMSGGEILEDSGVIAGQHIPIIPVYGRRSIVDGVEHCAGHVRNAKDPQRLMNMIRSKLGEIAAQSSAEVPIFDPDQMTDPNVRAMWEEQPVKNRPYLLAQTLRDADGKVLTSGPTSYTKPPQIPPALAALAQMAEVDLQDVLGNQQNAEEIQPNTSGKAVELVQQRLDMQTYIYISNFAKAMQRAAKVWLSMKQATVVEPGRKLKMIGPAGNASTIEMLRKTVGKDGALEVENDLSKAHMDVTSEVGPSSSTKRSAVVRALTGLLGLTADPETHGILTASVLQNIEGEGLAGVNEYFRKKMVRQGVTEPSDADRDWLTAEQRNKQPDPNAAYLLASADKEKAQTGKIVADTKLSEAKTIETLAGVGLEQKAHALAVAQAVQGENRAARQNSQPLST
jgi:hypothetical protein